MPVYLSRTKTVIRNIVWAFCMPESRFPKGEGRSINLPGIKITPRQILEALWVFLPFTFSAVHRLPGDITDIRAEHGGEEKLKLVDYEKDEKVITICQTWPGEFDTSLAESMGFEKDDKKTGFADAVGDFKEELRQAGKLV